MTLTFSDAVLDASLLVQAVIREKHTDAALRLLETLKKIYAPPLIFYEVGNTLVSLARRNLISKEDALRKLSFTRRIPTLTVKETPLEKALEMAVELNLTLYDASYLALAAETEAPLITADDELCEKGVKTMNVIHVSEMRL